MLQGILKNLCNTDGASAEIKIAVCYGVACGHRVSVIVIPIMDVGHEELFNPDRGSGVKSWPSLFGRLSVVFDQCLKKSLLKVVEKAASRICLKLKEWRAGHDAVCYWLYQGRVLGRLAVVFGCGCQNRCVEEGGIVEEGQHMG